MLDSVAKIVFCQKGNNDKKQSSGNLFYRGGWRGPCRGKNVQAEGKRACLICLGAANFKQWVASQKLLASPVARPLIEALDYAQRTNTIGSLKSADVCINWAAAQQRASELASALALHQFSRSITAPMALAQSQPQVIIQENKELKEIIARLNERLDEPFVTVNTVTGDKGIKQAQDEYQRLMNNKSPKSKRK